MVCYSYFRKGIRENMNRTAILVGLYIESGPMTRQQFDKSLREMKALADALDIQVAETLSQSLESPEKGTLIGSGKVTEVLQSLRFYETDLVLFDNSLTPMQMRNLVKELDCEVMDRPTLILRIFSDRARTREAKLQVEEALLKYTLPRLAGMRDGLSRQGGTSGSMSNRGAGETKMELDRRRIEHRISEVGKALEVVERERATQRKRRESSGLMRVSLVGYTNAGKSTVMNRMLRLFGDEENKQVFEQDMLFATLDTSVRRIEPKGQMPFLLSDTVGFVSDLPTALIKAFRSTLEEIRYADVCLHIIDCSDPDYRENMEVTKRTLEEIGAGHVPTIEVFNKADLAETPEGTIDFLSYGRDRIRICAKEDADIQRLVDLIEEVMSRSFLTEELLIPFSEGGRIGELQRKYYTQILEYTEEGTLIRVTRRKEDRKD